MKKTVIALLGVLAASACGQDIASQDAATTATMPDGTPAAVGVVRLVNDGTTDLAILDVDANLDRRAAEGILELRDGADGVLGTHDDQLFDRVSQVDGVPWVGPSALSKLKAYASSHGFVPSGDDELGVYDGVTFTVAEASATVALANDASESQLDDDLGLDSRAVQSIVNARPILSTLQLSELYYVGASALTKLESAATPDATGPSEETFAADLEAALIDYYDVYGDDIVASGGNDLAAAQTTVDAGAVFAIEDSEDDPEGHDLQSTLVFSHPDPSFPGSDNMWFGAYDAASGELLGVYSFN
jgi:hypothetical protein